MDRLMSGFTFMGDELDDLIKYGTKTYQLICTCGADLKVDDDGKVDCHCQHQSDDQRSDEFGDSRKKSPQKKI